MPKAVVNGIEMYYELHGPEEAEVVVLSNGVLMSTASWAFQTAALANKFRVLLYDCRGMWQSDHPEGPYSMEMHAADLAGLLDALAIEQAHIAGISYGSEVSMAFAIKYPQRVRSLVLADGVSQIDALLKAQCESWVTAAKAKDADLLFEVTYPLNFSGEWIAKHRPALAAARERYHQLDFEAFLRLMDSFLGFHITPELHQITAPTLVIVAENDLLKSRKYSEMMVSEIPNAEFVIIPYGGHAVCLEQPDIFNTLLLGFFTKHSEEA
ncbi:MAG: alpha/beta hydrolase [Anaerolineaceae bacterium]|jgi:3-oxoadipate enol-lactonase|nr:alpha/beta hydrolase [Anaerolineaceae bacterium]